MSQLSNCPSLVLRVHPAKDLIVGVAKLNARLDQLCDLLWKKKGRGLRSTDLVCVTGYHDHPREAPHLALAVQLDSSLHSDVKSQPASAALAPLALLIAPCLVSWSDMGWSLTPLGTPFSITAIDVAGKQSSNPAFAEFTLTGFVLATHTRRGGVG
eukprot:CAMPEP_0177697948 /NCGR_PEP_ID=MMETSP0484_2-20121128/4782_1 /TAXON_ID=354590 /ORGANISM="Rhodomonas lens, Strain RHODO" /LENGTH=155 /DNA_ID=CAMNT_0019209013 /DNA_START=306 /DNA_END=774 /DNA_ORIENTATION=-